MNKYQFNATEHLHSLDGKPLTGTSSVMEIVAKPLTWWAAGQAVGELGWTPITTYVNGKPRTLPREPRLLASGAKFEAIKGMSNDEYLTLLDSAYKAHSKTKDKAATKGKNLHATLERYVKACLKENEGQPMNSKDEDVQKFIDWACENVDTFLWSEMHTYSVKHWLGGISDVGAKLNSGKIAIIDFKSSKAAYASQFWQIGGYDIQIEENGGFDSKGNRIFDPIKIDEHIIIPFGAPEFTVEGDEDTIGNRNAYLAALTLYRENQRHD